MNKEEAIALVTRNGLELRNIPQFRNDKDVVMAAVHEFIGAFEYASAELQDDKDVVLNAIRIQRRNECYICRNIPTLSIIPIGIRFVSGRLKGDKDVMMQAVAIDGLALIYATDVLKTDRDVVTAAIRQNGGALQYAADVFKKDIDVATMAIRQNGIAICFTPFTYRKDLCTLALKTNPHAFRCLTSYHGDKNMAMLAVSKNGITGGNGLMLRYVKNGLNDDRDVVMAAVNSHGAALEYASERLQNDETIVVAAIQQSGMALRYASPALKREKHIVIATHGNGLMYADPIFKDDLDVIMTALEHNESMEIYNFASQRCKMEIVVIEFMYNKFGKRFLDNVPAEAWTKPNVLDWATRIPEEDIPEQFRSKVNTYKDTISQQSRATNRLSVLPDSLVGKISSYLGGKSRKRTKAKRTIRNKNKVKLYE